MRLSTRVPTSGPFHRCVGRLVEMERRGLDVAWMPEAYGLDAATRLGYLAASTTTVQLGSGIFNIYSRTPTLLAQTAATLDDVSGGRAILGLGSSGPQVIEGWHGLEFARPLARTREVVDICRRVWDGASLNHDGSDLVHDGEIFQIPRAVAGHGRTSKALRMHADLARRRIPVYLASLGPKNVELAAEIAEGWLSILYIPELADQIWGKSLAGGRARRCAEIGDLEIVAGGAVAIGDDVEHLRERLRPSLTMLVGGFGSKESNFYNDVVASYGFEAEAKEVQDLYLSGRRREAEAAVPAKLLEATSLIGREGYVRDRVDAYRDSGVTMLDVIPVGPDPARTIGLLKEWA